MRSALLSIATCTSGLLCDTSTPSRSPLQPKSLLAPYTTWIREGEQPASARGSSARSDVKGVAQGRSTVAYVERALLCV